MTNSSITTAQAEDMRARILARREGLSFVMPDRKADKSLNHRRGTPARRKRRTIL
jgi:hypothetical protein